MLDTGGEVAATVAGVGGGVTALWWGFKFLVERTITAVDDRFTELKTELAEVRKDLARQDVTLAVLMDRAHIWHPRRTRAADLPSRPESGNG